MPSTIVENHDIEALVKYNQSYDRKPDGTLSMYLSLALEKFGDICIA